MHELFMRQALRLARQGYGSTSPNPMVGALLVKAGAVIGRGWHHRAGAAHAEIEALRDAERCGCSPRGATLYVTLEPCSTQGRTPPCTEAIVKAGIRLVVVGATDPNPQHRGKAFQLLARAGISVLPGILKESCERLNEAFNHWIVQRTPWITVKAAMSLDGKIATSGGESKWITGEPARAYTMRLRKGADAILVGINTVLADDPSLTVRPPAICCPGKPRRIVLDARARTPLEAKVVSDEQAGLTTIVVAESAPPRRIAQLRRRVKVWVAPRTTRNATRVSPAVGPSTSEQIPLPWLLQKLGAEAVTSLLVEGGGEVNASFLLGRLAHRVAFFYAPAILGGRNAPRAVAGAGAASLDQALDLTELEWRRVGADWLLNARVSGRALNPRVARGA